MKRTRDRGKINPLACVIGYDAAMVAIGLISGSLGPSLPVLATQARTDLSGISAIFVTFPVGYTSGALVFGRLLDRHPGHRLLVLSVLLSALSMFFVPLAPNLTLLCLVMALLGFGQAGLDVGSNTLLGWVFGNKVGPYMNALHFSFGFGAITAPLVVARYMKSTGGITRSFWILALLMLPVALWLARLESPAPQREKKRDRVPRIRMPLVWLFALSFVLYSGLELGYGNWISTYALALTLEDKIGAAYLASAFWAALTLGRFVGIPLSARLKPTKILLLDILGCGLSVAAVLVWPASHVLLWAGTLGAGFWMASIFATLMTLAGSNLTMTGRMTSLFFIAASLGAIVFPWSIGQGIEPWGPRLIPASVLAIALLTTCVFLVLYRQLVDRRPGSRP